MSEGASAAGRVALFGEVLLDVLPGGTVPGGAPLNVARHLRELGAHALLISRVGEDEDGLRLLEAMERWGLSVRGVQRDPGHRTGRVLVRIDDDGGHRFEIPPGQAWDFIDPVAARDALRAAEPTLVYFGTLAQRGPRSHHTLWNLLPETAGLRLLDVNLREPWFAPEIVETSLAAAELVKLNESEMSALGEILRLPGGLASRACALIEMFSLLQVVVTRGDKGALVFGADGFQALVWGAPLGFHVVDTVGAGDAFAAVHILGLLAGWPAAVALARADSFARAICGIRGAVPEDPRFYEPFISEWQLEHPKEGSEPSWAREVFTYSC